MSKHLHHSTKLYAQHLAEIDEKAAAAYRQRKADEEHASMVVRSSPPPTGVTATTEGQ